LFTWFVIWCLLKKTRKKFFFFLVNQDLVKINDKNTIDYVIVTINFVSVILCGIFLSCNFFMMEQLDWSKYHKAANILPKSFLLFSHPNNGPNYIKTKFIAPFNSIKKSSHTHVTKYRLLRPQRIYFIYSFKKVWKSTLLASHLLKYVIWMPSQCHPQ